MSLSGDLQGTFTPDPDPGFGIRTATWHPSGLFLAVGGWDDKVCIPVVSVQRVLILPKIHILDSLSWSPVATLELSNRIPAGVVRLSNTWGP